MPANSVGEPADGSQILLVVPSHLRPADESRHSIVVHTNRVPPGEGALKKGRPASAERIQNCLPRCAPTRNRTAGDLGHESCRVWMKRVHQILSVFPSEVPVLLIEKLTVGAANYEIWTGARALGNLHALFSQSR